MRGLFVAGLALLASAASACGVAVDDDDAPPAASPPAEAAEAVVEAPRLPVLLPPVADLSPFEQALGERMRAIGETTVLVEMWSGDTEVGHGSGVLVSPDGDVLTAAHVAKHAGVELRVVLPDGQRRHAEVAARDEVHDAALLRAPGEPTAFARVRTGPVRAGEWVVCAGHGAEVPGDRVPMRSVGVVVQRSYAWTVAEYAGGGRYPHPTNIEIFRGMLKLDCATAPGMSGGPVVDLDGNLVGVVVGSPPTAAPLEAIRLLLPPSLRVPAVSAPGSFAAAPPTAPANEGLPSRAAAIAPLFASLDVERSLIELDVGGGPATGDRVVATVISVDGLAVAPAGRLVAPADTDAETEPAVAAKDITVVGHPEARCTEIVAVRGELALLRLSGLHAPVAEEGAETAEPLRPVGPAGVAAVGELVAAVGASAADRMVGFVTAVDRHPGAVAPDAPRWGCGTHRMMFTRSHPPVVVSAALAHDVAGWPRSGSLLVDRSGRPIAVEIARRATGVGFAIPWSEVSARFDAWMPRP